LDTTPGKAEKLNVSKQIHPATTQPTAFSKAQVKAAFL
jgi:hypothetical protein